MHVRLIITAEGPLLFSVRKPGGIFQESLPYIPGSVLRGAMAEMVLQGREHKLPHAEGETCEFCRLFLDEGAAIFTNAYPARSPEEEVRVLPATAVSCKNSSGFLPAKGTDEQQGADREPATHGVFDTLVERLCWEMLDPPAFVYNPTCPICGGRVEAYTGFYVRHRHDGYATHYHKRDVDQRLLTRVAINRRRMVAEDGLLYSPYVISQAVELDRHGPDDHPGYTKTLFIGHVWRLPKGYKERLKQIAALGGSSSRGLGYVSIKVDPLEEDGEHWRAVKARVEALDREIGAVWEQFQRLGGKRDADKKDVYFAIGLWSDAILRTADGLPTMVFDEEMLEAATGIEAKLVRSYASYGYGGGWQSAWGLPKSAVVLTRRGSVYIFRAGELTDTDYQALADLEISGIGEQTVEGYGQVCVSDEFHLKRRGPNERQEE